MSTHSPVFCAVLRPGRSSLPLILLLCLAVVSSGAAYAQQIGSRGPFKPTAADLALLPEYCHARVMPPKSPQAKRWSAVIGTGWVHIHHYCLALKHLNDIRFSPTPLSRTERGNKLQRVVAEIGYVERTVDARFPLWNEMMMHKMQAQAELSALGAAR